MLLEGDLFGAVAEAKEVAAVAGQFKEAKKQRAYDSYRLLAQGITFRTHAAYLLSLVRRLQPDFPDFSSIDSYSLLLLKQEVEKQRAYDSYRLLAQGSTFCTHAAHLLSLVQLLSYSNPADPTKLQSKFSSG